MPRRTPPPAPPRDDAPTGCVCSGCCCTRGGAHCRARGCGPCTDPNTTTAIQEATP